MTSKAQLIDELRVARQQISSLEKNLGEALGVRLNQPTKEILPIEGAFETSSHGIVIIQPQTGLMIRCNPAFARLVWRSIQDVIGLPFLNLTVADDHRQVIQTISELNNQENTGCEAYFIHKDGTIFPAQVDFTGIQDADGNIIYCVATLQDITERKNAEETLRLANVELERALRLKDEFLAKMIHELRTPLNAILGIPESLTEQMIGPLNEKQLRYIGVIYESGRHLLDLINDILDLSKVEAGKISLDLKFIEIKAVCEASFCMVKELANKKQQEFSFEMDNPTKMIWADERRLKQMLVNLLSNAVKFTQAGGKFGLIVEDDPAKESILLTVWDNGIGIKPGDLPHIFQPFIQLDAGLVREQPGTGLGLALVAEMARLHGGSVSVESQLGLGSRFKIFLPMVGEKTSKDQLRDTGINIQNTKTLPDVDSLQTILIIEDIETISVTIQAYLTSAGFRVFIANDGMDGVFQARNLQPDLILIDIEMPIMDGFEVTKLIRSEPELTDIPMIAMTAMAMPRVGELCQAAGMAEYISKPVIFKDVLILIRRLLDSADVRGK